MCIKLYAYIKIAKCIDSYVFYDAVIDKIYDEDRYASLHISTVDDNGRKLSFETDQIYSKRSVGILSPYADDFYGKRVIVANNRDTDRCVVVKIIGDATDLTNMQRYV